MSNRTEASTGPFPEDKALSERPVRVVTVRAVLLGLALLPLNACWQIQMEAVRYTAHPTTVSLFFNCLFILVVLTCLNGLTARSRWPGLALRQGELLLIYSMLCIGSAMGGHDWTQILVPELTWPYGRADASNDYAATIWRFLPSWAMVTDREATEGFYQGNDTLFTPPHLRAWARPALIWCGFGVVLLFVMQCINVLIRQQWTENERLTYPLTHLPLELTDSQPGGRGARGGEPSMTRNRLFYIGFLLAATLDIFNSLNYYYPSVPALLAPGQGQSLTEISGYFPGRPWNAMGWTVVSFYPFVVGLGMLMPMDFLFSSWFFFLVWKLQNVVVATFAWDADSAMPYAPYQGLGAYLLFFTSTLWLSRTYLTRVVRHALGLASDIDDSQEPLSYRAALVGLAAGLAALVIFCMALGMSWWIALVFFLLYLAIVLAITRMRAELGTPVHDLHNTGPDFFLVDLIGARTLGAGNLAGLSLLFWTDRAYRSTAMPHGLESFKLAEQGGGRGEMRRWFWALMLAGAVGMFCAFWAEVSLGYTYGYTARFQNHFYGPLAADRLTGWLKQPQPGNAAVGGAVGVGFLFALFLQGMRVRFPWWPLHPLAYAVSGSWQMNLIWMPLLIAWIVKSLLLRYGGLALYRRSLPFFYGLILGQFIPGSLLNLWGVFSDVPTYQFWQ